MMKLRSQYVPEGIRATTLNLFRVPLNLFVCLVLYNVRSPSLTTAYLACLIGSIFCCQFSFGEICMFIARNMQT